MRFDLVFEGGGAKGMVFVGALQAFEAAGHTPGRLLGTSAGAITATLMAAGYSAEELLAVISEREGEQPVFATFMGLPEATEGDAIRASATRAVLREIDLPFVPDRIEDALDDRFAAWMGSSPHLRHVFSFVEHGGWYAADNFLKWMQRSLDAGTFRGARRAFGKLSLAEFHRATGVDLTLVASDLTGQQMLILNHHTAPDVPVVWATRMSMNIPLLWQEVIWQPSWGLYRGRAMEGHAIVDGGLLSNFPLELLVSRDARVTALMGARTEAGVLGLMIDESKTVAGIEAEVPPSGFTVGGLPTAQRLANLVNTALSARDKLVIDAFEGIVVRLPAKGYGTTEFDMTDARRELLVAAGRDAMRAHLEALAEAPVSFGLDGDSSDARAERAADRLATRLLA